MRLKLFFSLLLSTSYSSSECPRIISREQWGARKPVKVEHVPDQLNYLFLHHTYIPAEPCPSLEECAEVIRGIQDFHMDDRGYYDIGYSFLIGGDGQVYEGRGFNVEGGHTYGFNNVSLGVSMIGDFTSETPSKPMIDAFLDLAQCMEEMGDLSDEYALKAHLHIGGTECPGQALFQAMQSFPHYVPGHVEP